MLNFGGETNLLNRKIRTSPRVESEGEGSVDVLFLAPYVGTRHSDFRVGGDFFFVGGSSGVEEFDWPQPKKGNKIG